MQRSVEECVKQRRRQILVHSYIYYELNQNIVSDAQWNKWASELVKLQEDNPQIVTDYQEQFKGWDGSTGAFFEYDTAIISIANHLIAMQTKKTKPKTKKKASKGRRLF